MHRRRLGVAGDDGDRQVDFADSPGERLQRHIGDETEPNAGGDGIAQGDHQRDGERDADRGEVQIGRQQRGEVEVGFVYTTDVAVRSSQVVEAFRPAEDTYRPVTYPAAVIKASKQPALAKAFVDLLVSRDGQAALSRLGFQPPPPGVR